MPRLTLTRLSANGTCTWGRLVSDDCTLSVTTKEGHIPADRKSYIRNLLPPGSYMLKADEVSLMFRGEHVTAPWLVFSRVRWFPKAGFVSGGEATAGRIVLCKGREGEFTETGTEEALLEFARYCRRRGGTGEPFLLSIVQDEAQMELTDYNYRDWLRDKAYEAEMRQRAEKSEFMKLVDDEADG